ncbi:hypothetical protein [Anaerotignum sp.]
MQGAIKITTRTQEAMAEMARELLKVGDKVKIKEYATSKDGTFVLGQGGARTGTVIEKSRWIFVVDFGRYRESFRYNQLFHGGSGDRVFPTGKEKPLR